MVTMTVGRMKEVVITVSFTLVCGFAGIGSVNMGMRVDRLR